MIGQNNGFKRTILEICNARGTKSLANRFGLFWYDEVQDWHLIVCDMGWIPQFMKAYTREKLTDDEKFALMEVIISSFEDLATKESLDKNKDWKNCEKILKTEFWLHISTIHYWSYLDEAELEKSSIAKYIRPIWEEVKHNFT